MLQLTEFNHARDRARRGGRAHQAAPKELPWQVLSTGVCHKKPSCPSSPSSHGASLGAGPAGEQANTCPWPRHSPNGPSLLPGGDSETICSVSRGGAVLLMQTLMPVTLPGLYLIQEQKSLFGSAAVQKAVRSPGVFLIQSTWAEEREKPASPLHRSKGRLLLFHGGPPALQHLPLPCLGPAARCCKGVLSQWLLARAAITHSPQGCGRQRGRSARLRQYPTISKSSCHEGC